MSDFSDKFRNCMSVNHLPVPDLETANEALEFIHKVHQAWETVTAGDDEVMMAGLVALLVAGGAMGLDEAALAALAEAGQVTVAMYLGACIGCLASAALADLLSMNAQGQVPDFVKESLAERGVDLDQAIA